jgi:hypothetical protein
MNYRKHYASIFLITMVSIAGFLITALLVSAFVAPMGPDLERLCEEFNDAGE